MKADIRDIADQIADCCEDMGNDILIRDILADELGVPPYTNTCYTFTNDMEHEVRKAHEEMGKKLAEMEGECNEIIAKCLVREPCPGDYPLLNLRIKMSGIEIAMRCLEKHFPDLKRDKR